MGEVRPRCSVAPANPADGTTWHNLARPSGGPCGSHEKQARRYLVRWDNRKRSRSFTSLREAERFARNLEADDVAFVNQREASASQWWTPPVGGSASGWTAQAAEAWETQHKAAKARGDLADARLTLTEWWERWSRDIRGGSRRDAHDVHWRPHVRPVSGTRNSRDHHRRRER